MSGSDADAALARVVVEQLFLLLRRILSYGLSHPSVTQAVEETRTAIAAARPPFSLQFVLEAVFRDRALVPCDVASYRQARDVARALRNCGVHEVSFSTVPEARTLLHFGGALARGSQGPTPVLDEIVLSGLSWREIPGAFAGSDGEEVDPDIFVATQFSLALTDAEARAATRTDPWEWSQGIAMTRRIERAMGVDADTCLRIAESAPGAWTAPRRALCSAILVSAVLAHLDASAATRRAAVHATLALGLAGLGPRAGGLVHQAASEALERLIERVPSVRRSVEPHRLRVCALARDLARVDGQRHLEVSALVVLAYQIGCQRCPVGTTSEPSLLEILASLSASLPDEPWASWLRAIFATVGAIPLGTRVRLDDGRVGVVTSRGRASDVSRPDVLVDGLRVVPARPVGLLSTRFVAGS